MRRVAGLEAERDARAHATGGNPVAGRRHDGAILLAEAAGAIEDGGRRRARGVAGEVHGPGQHEGRGDEAHNECLRHG